MRVVHLVMSNVFAGIEQHVNELILEQEKNCEAFLICNSEISNKFQTNNLITIKNFSRRSPLHIFKLLINIKNITPYLTIIIAVLLVSKIPTLALKKISISLLVKFVE